MPNNKRIEKRVAISFEEIRNSMIQVTQTKLKEITQAQLSGMTNEAILEGLGDGWEQSFLNETAQGIWESVKWITQDLVYDSLHMSGLYAWQYNPGAKHCEVCTELHGQIKSLEEWEAEGLPGHRNEGCYANCCCDLVRVEKKKVESIRKDSVTNEPLKMNINYSKLLSKDIENVDIQTWALPKEYNEELYITLKHIQTEMGGKYTFDGLKKIVAATLVNDRGEIITSLGIFNPKTDTIALNTYYYDKYYDGFQYEGSFAKVVRHEVGHFLVKKHNLKNDPEVIKFFEENKNYILNKLPFIKNYTAEKAPEEFLVDAFAWHLEGSLKQKIDDTKIYDFVREKFESLKELENNYKTMRGGDGK